MAIRIHGVIHSTCTQRVAVICYEKNVPFDIVNVDFRGGEHKSAVYREKQPFGQLPYIDDDDFILYESRAIAAYIARKYAAQGTEGLVPSDPKAHALYEQAVLTEMSHFDPSVADFAFEKVGKKMRGLEVDETRVNQLLVKLHEKLAVYEGILGKQKYLAGDNLTLADLYHLPCGTRLIQAEPDIFEKWPNVARCT